jgi:hypothetical protein
MAQCSFPGFPASWYCSLSLSVTVFFFFFFNIDFHRNMVKKCFGIFLLGYYTIITLYIYIGVVNGYFFYFSGRNSTVTCILNN